MERENALGGHTEEGGGEDRENNPEENPENAVPQISVETPWPS